MGNKDLVLGGGVKLRCSEESVDLSQHLSLVLPAWVFRGETRVFTLEDDMMLQNSGEGNHPECI